MVRHCERNIILKFRYVVVVVVVVVVIVCLFVCLVYHFALKTCLLYIFIFGNKFREKFAWLLFFDSVKALRGKVSGGT